MIAYNNHLVLRDIPLEAYDYVVNGKPAIEWIMECYWVTTDKGSGIENDPNTWSEKPRYALHRRSGQAHRARERGKRTDR